MEVMCGEISEENASISATEIFFGFTLVFVIPVGIL